MPQTASKAKSWQIVLIVVCLVGAAAGVAWYIFGGGPRTQLRSSVAMVDVGTGEIFRHLSRPGMPSAPDINPNTKMLSLMPVEQREDGKWYVLTRYLNALSNVEGGTAAIVNKESGLVNVKE